jgi:hypothetical protein
MTNGLHSTRISLLILATALLCAIAAALLPDNPYQRSQLLDGTIHRKSRWIYERVHFDPAPIDVVALGSSRVGAGFDAPLMQTLLASRGIHANVVNFSLPEAGRDINYAVFEDILTTKRPKLLILSVAEKPSRLGHSAFKFLARSGLVADPAYPGNINYLSNLAYLPYRQMKLTAARWFPQAYGLRTRFDPSLYWGHSAQSTGDIVLPDGSIKNGSKPAAMSELERGVHKLEAGEHPPMLPRSMAHIEFGDEHVWTAKIAELAKRNHVRIMFLFLPYYSGPTHIQEQSFYERYGPVVNAGFVHDHPEWYGDYGHMTSTGARVATRSIAADVANMLTARSVRPSGK